MPLKILRTVNAVRQTSRELSRNGKTIALVPTMGGLHDGHLALVKKAREVADVVVVSLFVNPTQFNNPEDLNTYPGDEKTDIAALEKIGTDYVFAPSVDEMYPASFATKVTVTAAREILCDAFRPGHFEGVATVVTKLFLQVEPDFACFGEKDFQQLFVIRRMAVDLDIPVKIIPVATVRETDGLAMSSRNARLSEKDRRIAPRLNAAMQQFAREIRASTDANKAATKAREVLEADGTFKVEYLEYRSGRTLDPMAEYAPDGRIFAAAWLGSVRLIDNIAV